MEKTTILITIRSHRPWQSFLNTEKNHIIAVFNELPYALPSWREIRLKMELFGKGILQV